MCKSYNLCSCKSYLREEDNADIITGFGAKPLKDGQLKTALAAKPATFFQMAAWVAERVFKQCRCCMLYVLILNKGCVAMVCIWSN